MVAEGYARGSTGSSEEEGRGRDGGRADAMVGQGARAGRAVTRGS
jgi:hypothetical protein